MVLDSRENQRLGQDAGGDGQRRAGTRWQKATGEGARVTPEETEGSDGTPGSSALRNPKSPRVGEERRAGLGQALQSWSPG